MIHHFILTRFYLNLWTKDKHGHSLDRKNWLKRRLELFERFCLPSIESQSCKDFKWILLISDAIDAEEKALLAERMKIYHARCPQIRPVKVGRGYSREFAGIFKQVVNKNLQESGAKDGDLCLTTYLDNDDMLHPDYVKNMQDEALSKSFGTFMSYDYGLQYFTELKVATRIAYPNNHFMTLVETCRNVKTCYGYGSHFLLEENNVAEVHHVRNADCPMWVEVIHEENVDNDVKMTCDTKLLKRDDSMITPFRLDVANGNRMKFFVRVAKQIVRRAKGKMM